MKLSILICSLEKRKESFDMLVECLSDQIKALSAENDVEIVVDVDNGEKPLGTKRDEMLRRAKGEYACFVDDDDIVPDYYVRYILKAIEQKPDCVGIIGRYYHNGKYIKEFKNTLKNADWSEDAQYYQRTVATTNPVRREHLVNTPNKGERVVDDRDYARRLRPLLKSEVMINKVMYHYFYDERTTTSK